MHIILKSWGLLMLCAFISLRGLHAQQAFPDSAKFSEIRMVGARFRIKEAPVADKWMEAQNFTWEFAGKVRIQSQFPILVKWNATQDSLFIDSIPGRGGQGLSMAGTDFSFSGQFLVRNGYIAGKAGFRTPGMVAESGELEINETGLHMTGSKLRFISRDSATTMLEIIGGFQYYLNDPATLIVEPALSSFAKLCGGKWLSPFNVCRYDLSRQEILATDDRGLETPLYINEQAIAVEASPRHRLAYLTAVGFRCSLLSGQLRATQVTGLWIADAKIRFQGDSLTLDQNGNILPAEEAELSLFGSQPGHLFSSAKVTFPTCSTYAARGFYELMLANGQVQRIPMELKLQGDTMAIAQGEVEGPGFYLNEGFQYRGTMELDSRHKEIRCKGVIQVNLKHPYFEGQWFSIHQPIDPDSLVLDFFQGKAQDSYLSCGVHLDSIWGPYPTFMGKKYSPRNHDCMRTWGSMAYDAKRRAFSIGSRDILTGKDLRGGVVRYTIDSTNVIAEGPMSLPQNLTPAQADLRLTGYLREDAAAHEIKLNLFGQIDLDALPKEAIHKITDQMQLILAVEETWDHKPVANQIALANLLDPDLERKPTNYRRFMQDADKALTYHQMNVGEHFPLSILSFSNFQPIWDQQMASFWHADRIAILSFGDKGVNKFTNSNSKIELRAVPASKGVPEHAELRIYLEFDDLNWIYLNFTPDGLQFVSSDEDLMKELQTLRPRKNNKLILLTEADKDLFLNRFVNTYIWRTGR